MSHTNPRPYSVLVAAVAALAGFAGAADAVPKGYTLLKATPAGRAMAVSKPAKAVNVRDALEGVLDDLDDYFDDDYDVYGAAANKADGKSAIATLAAKYDGKSVRGVVSARLTDAGMVGLVVFCRADAPPAALAELLGQPAAPQTPAGAPPAAPGGAGGAAGAGATPPAPPPRPVELKTYNFPDNTGSVGVADGWQTHAQSGGGAVIDGPDGAQVALGQSFSVSTPNSTAVQLARQYPVPGQVLLVAPFEGPAEAIARLAPQLGRLSQSRGGPAFEVDHVELAQELPADLQGGKSGVVRYGLTKTEKGQSRHFQAVAQVSVAPLTNEAWMFYSTVGLAPDDLAAREGPAILAMINSWRVNGAAVQAKADAWCAGQRQWFAGEQAAHQSQVAANDAHNAQWHADQTRQDRANDDWTEAFRGVTDVRDTLTGETKQTNLGHVDDLLRDLNTAQPGRYEQFKLKDKLDPVPGR